MILFEYKTLRLGSTFKQIAMDGYCRNQVMEAKIKSGRWLSMNPGSKNSEIFHATCIYKLAKLEIILWFRVLNKLTELSTSGKCRILGMTKLPLKMSHLGNSLIYMNKEEESSVVVGEGPSNSGNCMRLLLEVLTLRVLKKNSPAA